MRARPFLNRAKAVARRVRGRLFGDAIVLIYHRVTRLVSDPQLLAVDPDHFATHLEHLQRHWHPMTLAELTRAALRREIPRRAVAITFDDGYADNLLEAEPLLARSGIPATVFISTALLDSDREFYWDELDRIVLQREVLPDVLRLPLGDSIYERELDGCAFDREEERRRDATWTVAEPGNPTSRHRIYRELCSLLKLQPDSERQRALEGLREWAGVGPSGRRTHRTLTWEETARLARSPVIDIGAHTHTHPTLSALEPGAQADEIRRGRDALRRCLDREPTAFAYPYGAPSDYTSETARIVRDSGFEVACSNSWGLVRKSPDVYELPRVLIRDWKGDEFAALLATLTGWRRA